MLTPRWRVVAVLPLALVLGACAAVNPGRTERTISVTGEGSVVVTPDTVVVTLGVQTRGPQVGPTVANNNRAAEQVVQAVTDLGVAPEDVQTTYFSISIQPRYDQFGNPTEELTYWVDNTITVTLRDIALLGDLLGDTLARGANSVQGISYTLSDPAAALEPARQEALNDAQSQAVQLASASGMSLGPILTVTESSGGAVQGLQAYGGAEAPAGGGVPTTPGTLEYSVQLFVTYELR
jgi:uncharacterized protein YggE